MFRRVNKPKAIPENRFKKLKNKFSLKAIEEVERISEGSECRPANKEENQSNTSKKKPWWVLQTEEKK